MGIRSANVVTIECDSTDCSEKFISVGEQPAVVNEAWEKGWGEVVLTLSSNRWMLCPVCYKEIETFLDGENDSDPSTNER